MTHQEGSKKVQAKTGIQSIKRFFAESLKRLDIVSAEKETNISKFTGSYLTYKIEKNISISFLRILVFRPYSSIT